MFTGIVETTGKIILVETHGSNKTFFIQSGISPALQIDQSISHNGVCLTVEQIHNNTHKVTAIQETLDKTTLHYWKPDDLINLERSMLMNGRIDGHIVQGHVDCTASCTDKRDMNGSWEYTFSYDKQFASLLIEKGSICIDGVSLTAFQVLHNAFTVAIIPYTYANTNFSGIQKGSGVNIEFDILGKYVQRILSIDK